MAGSLIKIDEEIVSSAVASVTLTGIDSTYDVYMVRLNNVQLDTTSRNLLYRFTASGTPQTTANYDYAQKTLRADTTFQNESAVNGTYAFVNASSNMGIGTGQTLQSIMYLFNFNNSSEYSFEAQSHARDQGICTYGFGSRFFSSRFL